MMIRFKIGIFSKRGMPNCFFVTDLNTNLKNASSFLTANAWMSQDFNPTWKLFLLKSIFILKYLGCREVNL